MVHLLLVEDHETLGFALKEFLQSKGYQVTWAPDGLKGLQAFKKQTFNLCILDVALPGLDGFSLAAEIRRLEPGIPFVFLTARSLKTDKLQGFAHGADDYIVKPIDEDELDARIQAILRRSVYQAVSAPEFYSIGSYTLDYSNQLLIFGEQKQALTEREAQLLRLLCEYQGRLLPRQLVLKALWQQNDYFTRRSMDVFVSRLRKYLSQDPAIQIENVYGSGFILKITQVISVVAMALCMSV